MQLSFKHIAPFLITGQNKVSRLLGYFGLGTGVLLLLCAVQLFVNIHELLKDKNPRKTGYDYVVVTKTITNENMAADHSFTEQDLSRLKTQPAVDDVAAFHSNRFVMKANGGNTIPFETDLFFESINEHFLDTVPPSFTWKEGQTTLPIIMSSDYLELYNTVFAPSRDLPQFSERTVSSLMINIDCFGFAETRLFRGNVVALSDRLNTVVVPESFLQWANTRFAHSSLSNPNKILLKTKDANNPELLKYLAENNYHLNKDKTRFGRIKQVLQAIVSGLAAFGILVIMLAMVLFSFYLQLMIARSRENLQLLLTLGYSPDWLSKTVAKKWIPFYTIVVFTALAITAFLQWIFQRVVMNRADEISPFIHWTVILFALLILAISIAINFRLVRKLLYRL